MAKRAGLPASSSRQSGSEEHLDDETDQRPLKRVRRACTKCQDRRIKCSGARPCPRCVELGCPDECVVPAVQKRATQDRIRELEYELAATKAALVRARASAAAASGTSPGRTRDYPGVEQQHALFLGQTASGDEPKRTFAEIWPDEDTSNRSERLDVVHASPSTVVNLLPQDDLPHFILPDDSLTVALLEVFETTVQPIYPVLFWSDFMRTFQLHRASLHAAPDRVWLGTLLTVLAHAMQSAPRHLLEQAHAQEGVSGTRLFAEALQVLGFSVCMTVTSAELVQCLLLMTAFAQTLNQPDLSVSMVSLAIHKARILGFSPATRSRTPKPLIARVCWSACISRDFYVSTALGKLPLLTDEDVTPDLLPLTLDEERAVRKPGARFHPLTYFHETVKLHYFGFRALHRIYPYVDGQRYDTALVMELDEGLLKWRRELPAYFKEDPAFARHNTYVQLRFWYNRHLIHRPSFCHLLARFSAPFSTEEAADFSANLAVLSAQTAAEAALNIVDIEKEIMINTTAWWINLISIYTACLTLITAIKIDSKGLLSSSIAPKRASTAIDEALAALRLFTLSTQGILPDACRTSEHCEQDIQRIRHKMTAGPAAQDGGPAPPIIVAPENDQQTFWPQWQDRGDVWADLFSSMPCAGETMSIPPNNEAPFDFTSLLLDPGLGDLYGTDPGQPFDFAL